MIITLIFALSGLAYFSARILAHAFLNLWESTYDEITADCSRVEHFFPTYRRDPADGLSRLRNLI